MTLAKGKHYCGMYFGHSHIIVKSLPFLLEGLNQNAKCFVFMEDAVLEKLVYAVEKHVGKLKPGAISRTPLEQLMRLQMKDGKRGLRRGLIDCLEQANREGYSQIRLVGDTAQEISAAGLSLDGLLRWEQVFHQATGGLPIFTMRLYDAALGVDVGQLSKCHHGWIEVVHPPECSLTTSHQLRKSH